MTHERPQPPQSTDYDWEVALADGRRLHPNFAVIQDSGWVMCNTDGATHYFPPHAVTAVSKQLPDE